MMLKVGKALNLLLHNSLTLAIIAFAGVQSLSAEEKVTLGRELLLQQAVELPGKAINAKMIRVTFSPGYKTPWHTHRGPGPRYVLKGKLKIVEGGRSKIYSAGQVFWESGARMSAENIGKGEAKLVIFELAPAR